MSIHARVTGGESSRCPSCGALNPPRSQWCGQCFARYGPTERQGDGLSSGPSEIAGSITQGKTLAAVEGSDYVSAPASRPPTAGGGQGPSGDTFRVTDEGITWACLSCGTSNPLDADVCDVCGAPFAATIIPSGPERPARDPGTAALLSLFLPGAGHAYAGLWPQAVARGLVSIWIIAMVFVSAVAGGAGSSVIAGVFVVAGFAFWAVAAHDAYREAGLEGAAVFLTGRVFVFVVLALLVLLMASLVLAGARSGATLA